MNSPISNEDPNQVKAGDLLQELERMVCTSPLTKSHEQESGVRKLGGYGVLCGIVTKAIEQGIIAPPGEELRRANCSRLEDLGGVEGIRQAVAKCAAAGLIRHPENPGPPPTKESLPTFTSGVGAASARLSRVRDLPQPT